MNLVPWKGKKREAASDLLDLAAPAARMRNEMERLFERFLNGTGLDWPIESFAFGPEVPALDITETDDQVVVRTELPGVDPKELEVSVTGDMLSISGEKKSQMEKKGENFYHSERRFGMFRRTVRLPSHVDRDRVTADYTNGVLTITLKKHESAKAKKVPVRTSE